MKYYAVKNGVKPGIYTSWDECKLQVDGYKNALYKSFSNKADALNYLNETKETTSNKNVSVYVDGSFNVKTNEYSFGGVLICNNEEIRFSKKFNDDEGSSLRNVAGEVKGAAYILNYLVKNGYKEVDLYYDYVGIEFWYTKVWKANTTVTKNYVAFADSIRSKIKVNFIKIKSHSNDYYNDLADRLAKDVLGIK